MTVVQKNTIISDFHKRYFCEKKKNYYNIFWIIVISERGTWNSVLNRNFINRNSQIVSILLDWSRTICAPKLFGNFVVWFWQHCKHHDCFRRYIWDMYRSLAPNICFSTLLSRKICLAVNVSWKDDFGIRHVWCYISINVVITSALCCHLQMK